ncbi:MAG: hypothetical protein FWD61_19650 [Phycisphaerales bacterium]|nr:hypothetical protein [Phycisphaerales bacterium]
MRKIVFFLVAVSFVVIIAGCPKVDKPPEIKPSPTTAPAPASPKVGVFLYHLYENRNIDLVKDDSHGVATLELTFTLHGPAAATATRYGELKIDEAIDDTGKDLILP